MAGGQMFEPKEDCSSSRLRLCRDHAEPPEKHPNICLGSQADKITLIKTSVQLHKS